MSRSLASFREIVLVDFEFSAPPGSRPRVVCLVAHLLKEGRTIRSWQDELHSRNSPPYPIDEGALFVAYFASAELGCHLALDWPLPANVLDLFVEFRNLTNGRRLPYGASLLGALRYFGLPALDAVEKDTMRELAQNTSGWTIEERRQLLDYCEEDVKALVRLLPEMLPDIERRGMGRALLRGRYMSAVAHIERNGIPVDARSLALLRLQWSGCKAQLISEVDEAYGVFVAGVFKRERWAAWVSEAHIPWPRLESGKLALDDNAFREVARSHPLVAPMHQLRQSLGALRLEHLAVGQDSRNRTVLSPFRSTTGRNQPGSSRFAFGPSKWLRGIIRAVPGHSLAYIDWEQQEFGIAAALSRDANMTAAYESGDPYLEFAKLAGAVPDHATKETHTKERDLYKACCLAVQYLMGAESLSHRLRLHPLEASHLLHQHRRTFSTFWAWSDAVMDYAMVHSQLWTRFGWNLNVGPNTNPRSIRNFPMQANGAEVLRLACILATESGVEVCAPVHDALLIHAPTERINQAIDTTRQCMERASGEVLNGFQLRTDTRVFTYPDRYHDAGGAEMWARVWRIIEHQLGRSVVSMLEDTETCAPEHPRLSNLSPNSGHVLG